jgi:hypothetical protein
MRIAWTQSSYHDPVCAQESEEMTMMNRRWGGLAVLVAGAAIGLAACSGSGSSSAHVASLGKNSSDGSPHTTASAPAGSPAQLLDQWASCMRTHGDPGQIDPTVDASKVIQITLGAGYHGQGLRGVSGACGTYLSAAQTALGGGTPPRASSEATGLKFARCMRAHGVPDYPDPTGNGQTVHATNGSYPSPASPTLQAATNLCAKKTGYQSKFSTGAPQPGSINVNMAGGFGNK